MIDSWSLTAPIRNSFRRGTEFRKTTMTSGKRNFHSPNPLLIRDRRPPRWYKFHSLPNLPRPLKSKIAAMIFVNELMNTRLPKLRLICRLFNVPYQCLFRKSTCLGDLMGQTYPIYACTGTTHTHVISSVHGKFCCGWKQGFLK